MSMESVYPKDIKNAVNLETDDLVIACVVKFLLSIAGKRLSLMVPNLQIHGTHRIRKEQCVHPLEPLIESFI